MSSRIVQIVSIDKRYNNTVYKSVPIKDDSIGTYLTGQHIDPRVKGSENNLTSMEMTQRVSLTADKLKKFPYVLFVEEFDGKFFVERTINVKHGDKLEIGLNSDGSPINFKDWTLYNYFRNYCPVVAPSKKTAKKGQHYFFIEDLEAEAIEKNKIEDLVFEAESLVRSSGVGKYRDLVMLLNYRLKDFHVSYKNMTEDRIKTNLISVCKKNPEAIIACFDRNIETDLFILRLIDKAIIRKEKNDYYDGSLFLGRSLEDIKTTMAKDTEEKLLRKWTQLLNS